MAIRELSYVLRRDPATGTDELTLLAAVPEGVPDDLMERIITATHRAAPASGAALSYTRLPGRHGGGLLCSARPDEEWAGLRVDARYAVGDPDGTWPGRPIDAWRPRALVRPGHDPFADPDRRWDGALLGKFARDAGRRLAPFLADVRRLFADPAGRQIVVAEHDQETVARWIALACASLPLSYARALTFTTHTPDPGTAPQQILGIGPDTDPAVFDRCDEVTRTHLFRVHDGLGGPGSPRLTDTWAEVTAWLWCEGAPPRTDDDTAHVPAPDDAFTLLPLVRRALDRERWEHLDLLGDETLRDLVAAVRDAAERDKPDGDAVADLARFCVRLGEHRPSLVQPLALALARRRVDAASPRDAMTVLESCTDLHLDETSWRTLRAEYGPPPEDELRKMLRYSCDTWEKPLHALLSSGAGTSPVVEEAAERISRVLGSSDARRAGEDAIVLLAALDDHGFTRRVLERLAGNLTEHRVRNLRDLAASSHGDWLRTQLDGAPLAVRLAVSAGVLGRAPHHLRGADLLIRLAEQHLDGQVPDAPTLRLLWALVWPASGQLPREDLSRITQVCSASLIVEAKLEIRFTPWLRHPNRVGSALVDFARAAVHSSRLTTSERATARLLTLADDFERGHEPLGRVMETLPVLEDRAGELDPTLRDAIDYRIARGIARTDPVDLFGSKALRYVAGSMRLLGHYREAVADARREGGVLAPDSLRDPRRLAALFAAWRTGHRGATGAWRDATDELLVQVVGEALRQLDSRDVDEVVRFLARRCGEDYARAWHAWCRR
ncbi:GTPase-associated protein 1-related protein [Streptomyces bullii]|uniref:GTPase-associated protein 1-related protein n=1 Tax=Streptomyces bullii TaxID=349910 RepID=A0ABW0UNW6_9ACTN